MPEVILPCPACSSTDCECLVCTINADESQTMHFHMACNKCFTSGPIADDAESAKKRWNTIPRAPRWTHEPPKVAGWYWHHMPPAFGTVVEYFDPEISEAGCGQWAGPIPTPLEPGE